MGCVPMAWPRGRCSTPLPAATATAAELNVRFSRPVFPGETLQVRMWREADGRVRFDARIPARDVTVLSHGVAELRP